MYFVENNKTVFLSEAMNVCLLRRRICSYPSIICIYVFVQVVVALWITYSLSKITRRIKLEKSHEFPYLGGSIKNDIPSTIISPMTTNVSRFISTFGYHKRKS